MNDYDYILPVQQIAEYPVEERDHSKLLIFKNGIISDDHFYNICSYIPSHSSVILNNSRVIEARIIFQKSTGGIIEIFCLEPYGQEMEKSLSEKRKVKWQCLIGGASKWKPGQTLEKTIELNEKTIKLKACFTGKLQDCFVVEFSWEPVDFTFGDILHAMGNIPLPPYIHRKTTNEDSERYQTVFGIKNGSVAAPTAALHFTEKLLSDLESISKVATITLHVGAGTFKPVKSNYIGSHYMHREPFSVSVRTLKNLTKTETIISTGTTVLRTLESLYWIGVKIFYNVQNRWNIDQWEPYELAKKYPEISKETALNVLLERMNQEGLQEIHCSTSLLIIPGYDFKLSDGLITNFHQPKSTLLLLIAAFIGDDWKKIYQYALDHNYRFLSYGDSTFLMKKNLTFLKETQL